MNLLPFLGKFTYPQKEHLKGLYGEGWMLKNIDEVRIELLGTWEWDDFFGDYDGEDQNNYHELYRPSWVEGILEIIGLPDWYKMKEKG